MTSRVRLLARRALVCVALALAAGPASADDLDTLADIVQRWLASPHADHSSPSFTHWNAEGAVPVACATCHAQPGFLDHLGSDGSAPGTIESPAAIGAVLGCATCHTAEAHALDRVVFPSGDAVDGLDTSATCTVCHQGRQFGPAVAAAVDGLDPDTVSPDLRFLNIHYGVAAAVMHGADVRGGFHYPDRSYAGRFAHARRADTCVACHDPHTTTVETTSCEACHDGASDPRSIRERALDFDGDGDVSGGIHDEVLGLRTRLYEAIRTYAAVVAGTPIVHADAFPYFFTDADGDGTIAPADAIPPNRYATWTPRLLQAAYNYQVASKDPGGYVHNPDYVIQLLQDSLADLGTRIAVETADLPRP